MQKKHKSPQKAGYLFVLSVFTTVGLFVVNMMGFLDTETGSALGCGREWPLCQNGVFPETWNLQSIIEFSHRMIVFTVGLLLLVTCILVWRKYSSWLEIRVFAAIALGGVILESLLGALGVLFSDPPAELATHLGVAILSFTGSLLMTMAVYQIQNTGHQLFDQGLRPGASNPVFHKWALITLVYTYLAMYFGAYVANTGDGALFQGWPLPTERYAVVHSTLIVDIAHRTIALGLLSLVIWLVVLSRKKRNSIPSLYIGSLTALILVCSQAFSGAYLIYSHLSLPAFLTHVSIVTCLFATVAYLYVQTLPNRLPHVYRRRGAMGDIPHMNL